MVSDILLVAFTGVVALSTVVYALLTWRLVSETRKLREGQNEPHVSMRVEFSERAANGALELVIRNEGQGPAKDIHFRFQGDSSYFATTGRLPIDQLPVIRNGLSYLGSNQRFGIILGWLRGETFRRACESPWTFSVDYKNSSGKHRNERYAIDFSQFDELILRDSSPLFKIEQHLEKLQHSVEKLSRG